MIILIDTNQSGRHSRGKILESYNSYEDIILSERYTFLERQTLQKSFETKEAVNHLTGTRTPHLYGMLLIEDSKDSKDSKDS